MFNKRQKIDENPHDLDQIRDDIDYAELESDQEDIATDLEEFSEESSDDEDVDDNNNKDLPPIIKQFHSNNPTDWNDVGNLKCFDFLKTSQLLIHPTTGNNPIDYFNLLVEDCFLEKIVQFTNDFSRRKSSKNSKNHFKTPLTLDEFKIFLALLLHSTAVVDMPRWNDYWNFTNNNNNDDPLFKCLFDKFMSRERFLQILHSLCFEKSILEKILLEESSQTSTKKMLDKIQMVQEYFNAKMNAIYYPGKNLSIGKHCCDYQKPRRRRRRLRRHGMNLYTLIESNGIVVKSEVVCEHVSRRRSSKNHLSTNVVLDLFDEKLDSGHSLFLDYSDFPLSRYLLDRKTYCTGLLRDTNMKIPMAEGDENVGVYSEDGVFIGRWNQGSNNDVTYISTEFDNSTILDANKSLIKPQTLAKYETFMNSFDKHCEVVEDYLRQKKKSPIRWYKMLFIGYLQMLLTNGYLLYSQFESSKSEQKLTLHEFRLQIISSLLKIDLKLSQPYRSRTTHFPARVQGSNGKFIRKRCRLCYSKHTRRDSVYLCPACPDNPALCLECFEAYNHK